MHDYHRRAKSWVWLQTPSSSWPAPAAVSRRRRSRSYGCGAQPLLTVKQSKKVTASQDDESVGEREEKQQVLPLRFAPVPRHAGTGGMTSLWEN